MKKTKTAAMSENEEETTQTKKASVKKTDAKKTKKEEKKIEGTKGKGGNSQVKTLDELKEDYKKIYAEEGIIYQKDIMASLEKLDMNDDDLDSLWDWFRNENIDISEDEDIQDEMEADLLGNDADDVDDDDDEHSKADVDIRTIDQISRAVMHGNTQVQLNDPVKMYLKEIGRVPLLKPEDEPEIAKRIAKVLNVREETLFMPNDTIVDFIRTLLWYDWEHSSPFQDFGDGTQCFWLRIRLSCSHPVVKALLADWRIHRTAFENGQITSSDYLEWMLQWPPTLAAPDD